VNVSPGLGYVVLALVAESDLVNAELAGVPAQLLVVLRDDALDLHSIS
jgi:hypothetical protein